MHELSAKELEGLPPELLAQLSSRAYPHPVRQAISVTIGERGANIDDILIGVYRQIGKCSAAMARWGIFTGCNRMA